MLKHTNVVNYIDSFEDEHYFYIVMEQCKCGNLFKYLKRRGKLSEKAAAVIISQVLEAVVYMHLRGVVHRDLKLSNILLSEGLHVRLCDFGLAVQLEHPDEEHFTLCGTPNYIAPEVVSKRAHGFPADLWSIGCLFYFLVCGAPPAEQVDVKDIMAKLFAMNKANETTSEFSHGALDFMQCLLQSNPTKRASASEILAHPFLQIAAAGEYGHARSSGSGGGDQPSELRRAEQQCQTLAHQRDQQRGQRRDDEDDDDHDAQEDEEGRLRRAHSPVADLTRSKFDESIYSSPSRTEYQQHQQHQYSGRSSATASADASTAVTTFSHVNGGRVVPGSDEASTLLRAPVASAEPRYEYQNQLAHSPAGRPKSSPKGFQSPDLEMRRSGESTATGVSRKTKNSNRGHQGAAAGPVPGPMPHPGEPRNGQHVTASHVRDQNSQIDADDLVGRSWLGRIRSLRRSIQLQGQGHHTHHINNNAPMVASLGSVGLAAAALPPGAVDTAGTSTWVDERLQPIVYCNHNGELLIVSGAGDVLLCSLAKDARGNDRRYRVCVRAKRPLALLVGSMTDGMEGECRRLCAQRFDENGQKREQTSVGASQQLLSLSQRDKGDGDFTGLELLSAKQWVKEHDIRSLSPQLNRIRFRVSAMLEVVKRRQPRLVLYIKSSSKNGSGGGGSSSSNMIDKQGKGKSKKKNKKKEEEDDDKGANREGGSTTTATATVGGSEKKVHCKCMIMNNHPLPDFCIQWADDTKLRYALESGQLQVSGPLGQFHWDAVAETGSNSGSHGHGHGVAQWASTAPQKLRGYLVDAQRFMGRCLSEQASLEADGAKPSLHRARGVGPHIAFVDEVISLL
jgi:polo-like kinase 4